ncbi:hypothetical protein C0993_000100 [Termitomyces sp. T159_Od127]|nr:hypothetical protein C0993_000100 [Termitomyces sp. T159_Od127]
MDDEDSVNLEALQAQIDMSMAFAENMVSSWVKPSRKLSSRSDRDFEAELKEYMRRPPRLGVGAAIPEAANSSRDVARLKGQLLGKGNKRLREDDMSDRGKDDTDSEGETRGGVIKKKARVDPFTKDGKKNKHKTTPENVLSKLKPLAKEEAEKKLEESVNKMAEDVVVPPSPYATSKSRKSKNKQPTVESIYDTVQTPTSPASFGVLVNTSPSISLNKPERLATRSPVRKAVEPSAPANPLQRSRQVQSAALLKFPLLNLTPIHDDSSDHEDETKPDTSDGGPKKKRKRKKKKKKKDDTSASTAFVSPASLS